MDIIEKIKRMFEENGGRLPRNELFDLLRMNFKYYDPNEPTILRSIELACKDLGISMKYEENVLALVNALKGGKIDWEDAWLFVDNDLLGKLEAVITLMRFERKLPVGCWKLRKVTVNGKDYWLVYVNCKDVDGNCAMLNSVIKLKWPRVLADDGITTGFIVEEVNL